MAEAIRSAILADVPHGFMTRRGGVSTGAVASLNCGLGADDDPAAVAENRRRAAEAVLPGAALVGVYQVHSPDVVAVAEPCVSQQRRDDVAGRLRIVHVPPFGRQITHGGNPATRI